jgi:hypothetical protein
MNALPDVLYEVIDNFLDYKSLFYLSSLTCRYFLTRTQRTDKLIIQKIYGYLHEFKEAEIDFKEDKIDFLQNEWSPCKFRTDLLRKYLELMRLTAVSHDGGQRQYIYTQCSWSNGKNEGGGYRDSDNGDYRWYTQLSISADADADIVITDNSYNIPEMSLSFSIDVGKKINGIHNYTQHDHIDIDIDDIGESPLTVAFHTSDDQYKVKFKCTASIWFFYRNDNCKYIQHATASDFLGELTSCGGFSFPDTNLTLSSPFGDPASFAKRVEKIPKIYACVVLDIQGILI